MVERIFFAGVEVLVSAGVDFVAAERLSYLLRNIKKSMPTSSSTWAIIINKIEKLRLLRFCASTLYTRPSIGCALANCLELPFLVLRLRVRYMSEFTVKISNQDLNTNFWLAATIYLTHCLYFHQILFRGNYRHSLSVTPFPIICPSLPLSICLSCY